MATHLVSVSIMYLATTRAWGCGTAEMVHDCPENLTS